MNEIWRSIKDYEGLYEVSNWGRVRNTRTGRLLRPVKDKDGYLLVNLYKDDIMKHWSVHRLVAMTFPYLVDWTEEAKGKPFSEIEVNHKDEVKTNNCVDNLEWCDGFYNQTYSNSKTVYMYLNGKLCGLWPSTMECGRYGFYQSAIAACCRGKRKTHRGFSWSYEPPKPPKALPHYVGVLPCGPSGQGD